MNEAPPRDQLTRNEKVSLFSYRNPVSIVQLTEPLKVIEESTGDTSFLFWILALLFFGLGDTLSSFAVFSQGGSELNPVMRWALSLPMGLLGFVFLKIAAISFLYALSQFREGVHRWMIPAIMTIAGVYLTTSNSLIYFHMVR